MRVAVPNFFVDPHDAHDVMQKIISEDAHIPDTLADVVLYPLITCSNFGADRIDTLKKILCHTSVISIARGGANPSYTTYVIEYPSARISSTFEVDGAMLSVTYAPDGTAILKTAHQVPPITPDLNDSRTQALDDLTDMLGVDLPHSYEELNNLTDDDLVEMRIDNVDDDSDDVDMDDEEETPHIAGMMYVSSDGSVDDIAKHISDAIRKLQETSGLDEDDADAMNVEMIAEPLDMNGNPMSADDIPDVIKKQIEEVKRALSQQGVSFEVEDASALGKRQDTDTNNDSVDDMFSMSALQPYAYDPSTRKLRMPTYSEQIEYLTAKLHAYAKVGKPDFYIMDTTLKDVASHAYVNKETNEQAEARVIFILGYMLDLMHTRELMKKHLAQISRKQQQSSGAKQELSTKDDLRTTLDSSHASAPHAVPLDTNYQITKSESLKQFEAELLGTTHPSDDMCPYSYN